MIIATTEVNPHRNLAFEEALLENPPKREPILFLWQNAHTVVIGAGQNAWRECDVKRLEDDGGTLARRGTGGGAVYHDLGNLNFSFVMPLSMYDVERQLSVILRAVNLLGIPAVSSGRNDLTVDGKKFSGNAFRVTKDMALHHGTVLVSADMARVAKYLTVSKDKLEAKGVKSVRSRVANLSEFAPLTIEQVSQAIETAFEEEYGAGARVRAEDMNLAAPYERYASWAWNYGASPKGEMVLHRRFDFGDLELHITLKNGEISELFAYTDAMDEHMAELIKSALLGCRWDAESLHARLAAFSLPDVAAWLAGQI